MEKFIAFNCSSRHKQNVHVLIIGFLPVFALGYNLLDNIHVWPQHENYCLIFNIWNILIDIFVIECNLLLDLRTIWEIADHEREHLEQRFLDVNRFIPWALFKEFGELFVVMSSQESQIDLVLILHALASRWLSTLWTGWYLLHILQFY